VVVTQKCIEKHAELHHPVIQKLWVHASNIAFFGKWWQGIDVDRVIQVLFKQALKLPHARIPIHDVETHTIGSHHFENKVGVTVLRVVSDHLHLVGEFFQIQLLIHF
jgi:hypothetical protein